jgi:hypothetical protein
MPDDDKVALEPRREAADLFDWLADRQVPATLKPFCLSCCMPSFRMSWARFFSSSRSSSGRKPSVRNMLEGIPATARSRTPCTTPSGACSLRRVLST